MGTIRSISGIYEHFASVELPELLVCSGTHPLTSSRQECRCVCVCVVCVVCGCVHSIREGLDFKASSSSL